MRIVPMPTGNLSKQQRLEATTPLLDDPRQIVLFHPAVAKEESAKDDVPIRITSPTPETFMAKRTLREQLLNFPLNHDDALDAYVQGLRYAKSKYLAINDAALSGGAVQVSHRTAQINVGVHRIGF